jgi:hypothetical protein
MIPCSYVSIKCERSGLLFYLAVEVCVRVHEFFRIEIVVEGLPFLHAALDLLLSLRVDISIAFIAMSKHFKVILPFDLA